VVDDRMTNVNRAVRRRAPAWEGELEDRIGQSNVRHEVTPRGRPKFEDQLGALVATRERMLSKLRESNKRQQEAEDAFYEIASGVRRTEEAVREIARGEQILLEAFQEIGSRRRKMNETLERTGNTLRDINHILETELGAIADAVEQFVSARMEARERGQRSETMVSGFSPAPKWARLSTPSRGRPLAQTRPLPPRTPIPSKAPLPHLPHLCRSQIVRFPSGKDFNR
jgi:chromosome segregation ATPase